jgi:hypothetical protein
MSKLFGNKTKRLHRYIWEKYHGKIPKGMHIHHKDHDTLNNSIRNLELVSPKEHNARHYNEQVGKWRESMEVAREYASKWHGSKAGKKYHSKLGKENWKHWKKVTKKCMECGNEYGTFFPSRSKFCHLNCRAAALRKRRSVLHSH